MFQVLFSMFERWCEQVITQKDRDLEDLSTKLIRILANLSISETIGPIISERREINLLYVLLGGWTE